MQGTPASIQPAGALNQKLLGLLGSLGLVLVQDKRDSKGNQRGDRKHDCVLYGLGQAQQDAEDAGNAGAGSGKRGESADQAPQPPPMQPAMKGLKKRRFTPKMAGSVMPMKADRAEGSARPLILASRS